ncbi:acireductone synthase [Nocardia sp. NPDC004604]|uniref:acireductone synthase n=1 Tax=Nocardia sp. NPDC004604 TaxID=3157013 RepID=UPI0033A0A9EE
MSERGGPMVDTGDAVLLDIEGTVSPVAAVRNTLFGYARPRLADWLGRPDPRIGRIAEEVRWALHDPHADLDVVAAELARWSDADIKAEPLKALQGLIWQDGFATGVLTATLYDDVPPLLRAWVRRGDRVYIFSSGSELAQRLWFANTQFGDLSALISGHFDLSSAGPKNDARSYWVIAEAIGARPERIGFLSDNVAELDAAAAAGMRAVGVSRMDEGCPDVGRHPRITRFTEIRVGRN